jgi:hypothetical protein
MNVVGRGHHREINQVHTKGRFLYTYSTALSQKQASESIREQFPWRETSQKPEEMMPPVLGPGNTGKFPLQETSSSLLSAICHSSLDQAAAGGRTVLAAK